MTFRFLALLAPLALVALSPAPLSAREPVALNATVSAADPRAAQAGQDILRKGGSATDAAIAMMLALNVVEPHNSGIGGGGFLMHHDGATGVLESIDGRETAPAAAKPDRFMGPDGQPLSFRDAWPGGYSVGVPGNVRLAWDAHRKWGKLPWADLFQPAIHLAEDGFEVRQRLDTAMNAVAPIWADFPEIRQYFWIDGKPAPIGTILQNPPLAALFRRIAAEGPDAFYLGGTAKAIADAVTNAPKNPVPMTQADLAAYQAKPRKPVCGTYRVYTVCGMGPASSGGVTVLQILGMVERFPLGQWGKDDVRSWHVIGEAMQLAYADRDTWLGDPDFVAVPLAGLIDPAYLKRRSALISLRKARNDYQPGQPQGAQPRTASRPQPESGTSHFVAVDRNGDIAAWTSTIESFFGSQLVANGVILNNELTDFSFTPEKNGAPVANRVEPGKRPLSSMSPTIVYDAAGTPIFTVGAAGGKTIIMQVAKALIAHFDWGLSAQDSIALGLEFFNGDGLVLEQGTSLEAMKAPLERLGHRVAISRLGLKANAAERLPDGHWVGAADPRSPGVSLQE
ncbi:gamma-glutamyltranspeptidase/glutathione hydrolase [Sphingobium wenxiniae]|uniref:Glutathione hydrolase proenzyme n=1 Tax=Sphingobium wenxiniae (strain DSM 21828 / CGMCC 1.7748 / JZ-1) TaxID=595605 RepID=A0A562KB83_SPHWJ|nr:MULTISPECIES: gamma-glutamyltransferase [Sphingobium]MBB6192097.1 gamma-glutamyltranspeptidase/glutathione hydrolase [Sphingobium wenxiniae]TWH92475.1 gamma-glutamyltranspeptidase/glutathione hydrolase [Sphingobium wenxiniae]WRD75975.1 gamma-glutamyltransferase [Sphingobium baderi]